MGEVQRGLSNDLQSGNGPQETEIRQNGTGKNKGFPEHCAMIKFWVQTLNFLISRVEYIYFYTESLIYFKRYENINA